jgi:hypothetical protein
VSLLVRARCACARAIKSSLRFAFRLMRFLFILGLVMLPVPVAAFVAVLLAPLRRNLPAEVLRKKEE